MVSKSKPAQLQLQTPRFALEAAAFRYLSRLVSPNEAADASSAEQTHSPRESSTGADGGGGGGGGGGRGGAAAGGGCWW